jgi:small subunit ribosomal protein S9
MAENEKPSGSEQGEVAEPDRIAAEDAVGAQEQPGPAQAAREQEIADETVADARQRLDDSVGAAPDLAAADTSRVTPADDAPVVDDGDDDDETPAAPRVRPEIPGADLTPDIVLEGDDPLGRGEVMYDEDGEPIPTTAETDDTFTQPIADAAISLAADARYHATGKRKTAVARVILKPGTGSYEINGRGLNEHFPRLTLQRQIRQALETVGLEEKMDVIAHMHGGGISAQAGALRHGISRALVEADPNLRSELKRRGFMTRDARVKERKKAGFKKARKRPQFSKR